MCTVTRSPVASILSSEMLPAMLPVLRELMREVRCLLYLRDILGRSALQVILVARAEGVTTSDLSDDAPDTILKNCLEQYSDSCNANPSLFKPSMLVDLEAGRPIEAEPIVGSVVRAGHKHAVQTPR